MTIKETAGKLILYFYQLQRTAPLSMSSRQIGFIERKNGSFSLTSDKKAMSADMTAINPSATDVFNAFSFLVDKGFIETQEKAAPGARVYVGARVTSRGVDIIEGIEGNIETRTKFETTFNIKVDARATVYSLVQDQLKALMG